MVLFLTSSPTGDLDGRYICEGFDTRNGFSDNLRRFWPQNAKVLMITAFPEDAHANWEMHQFFQGTVAKSGLSCKQFDFWDADILQNEDAYAKDVLQSYDVLLLGGGHVPTQQQFFEKLHLREHIQGFEGIVIGISAGSMNCAGLVYAQPEEPGEAVDPNYQRFIPGLGITNINVLPHYQLVKDLVKDGLHLFRDISIPDSKDHDFIVLPDGSYVVDYCGLTRLPDGSILEEQKAAVYGKAYRIKNLEMQLFCEDGKKKSL